MCSVMMNVGAFILLAATLAVSIHGGIRIGQYYAADPPLYIVNASGDVVLPATEESAIPILFSISSFVAFLAAILVTIASVWNFFRHENSQVVWWTSTIAVVSSILAFALIFLHTSFGFGYWFIATNATYKTYLLTTYIIGFIAMGISLLSVILFLIVWICSLKPYDEQAGGRKTE